MTRPVKGQAPASPRIEALLVELRSTNDIAREAAVTRLTVLGAPAIESLSQLIGDLAATSDARTAGLRALEGIGHLRGLDVVLRAIDDADVTVAEAAANAARPFLRGPRGADAVDHLTAIALDRSRPARLRTAALEALSELDSSTLRPLYDALQGDPILGRPGSPGDDARANAGGIAPDTLADDVTSSGASPFENSDQARRAVSQAVTAGSLPALKDLVSRIRTQEDRAPKGRKQEWAAARGIAHAALATRGSRLALYDLRESLERAAEPLPLDFLLALKEIGDASCLEALAASHARVPDEWWRGQLEELFRSIAAREGLTKRHAAMKRIARRWPGIVQ